MTSPDLAGSRPRSPLLGVAGLLPRQSIRVLEARGVIRATTEIRPSQYQPASLDLRLGRNAYRVRASSSKAPRV